MAIWSIFDPIAKLVKGVGDIIDNIDTSDEERLEKKNELAGIVNNFKAIVLQHDVEMAKQQSAIILAEANGKSWMQRNARPGFMWVCIIILFNNFVVLPYIPGIVPLEFTSAMWGLFTVAIGGYIGAREYGKKQLMDSIKPTE